MILSDEAKKLAENTKCKHCGCEFYNIQELFIGLKQNLSVIYCVDYKCELLPIVVDYFCPQEDFYKKCKEVWDMANKPPEQP